MAPIQNATSEPALDAVTDMLRNQLAQSPFWTVLRPAQVSEALQRMAMSPDTELSPAVARGVAWRRQADVILTGRVAAARAGDLCSRRVSRVVERPRTQAVRSGACTFEARDCLEAAADPPGGGTVDPRDRRR